MHRYPKILLLAITYLWCSIGQCHILPPSGPLRSYITGGHRNTLTGSQLTDDCKQYANDFEILYYFPFLIIINPMGESHNWYGMSYAQMDSTDTFVEKIVLLSENSIVPPSVFCLKRLRALQIERMHLVDDILPNSISNIYYLNHVSIINTPMKNVTDRLSSLIHLSEIQFYNCSLTHLPDLSGLVQLKSMVLSHNQLTKLSELNQVFDLLLDNNLFTELPILTKPTSLYTLSMGNNPLKNVMTLGSFINLRFLSLTNTSISFIPPSIEKLQWLYWINLSQNQNLHYLPNNFLKLQSLVDLYLIGHSFSSDTVEIMLSQFNQVLPHLNVHM